MDLDAECRVTGDYPFLDDWYGYPYAPTQKLNPPSGVKANYLAYLQGQDYEWVPDAHTDKVEITPPCVPDIIACGFGGGLDSFGVRWAPDVSNPELPAFVETGLITLDDITKWRDLTFPDVDSWDWKGQGERYRAFYQNDDRSMRGVIMIGFFERMISLMGFQGAALSLAIEPEESAAFLDAIADVNIRMVDHYIDDFGCDSILFHDDWSAQRGPFFSLDTAMDILVPAVRKLTDHIHERGAIAMMHSCGNAVDLIPAIKAGGADLWQAQPDANDLEKATEACGDGLIIETYPIVPDGLQGDELDAYIASFLDYTTRHRFCCEHVDMDEERCFDTRIRYYRQARAMAVGGKTV